jgi:hypothetical protein
MLLIHDYGGKHGEDQYECAKELSNHLQQQ